MYEILSEERVQFVVFFFFDFDFFIRLGIKYNISYIQIHY